MKQDCETAPCRLHPSNPETKEGMPGSHRTQWRFGSWTPVRWTGQLRVPGAVWIILVNPAAECLQCSICMGHLSHWHSCQSFLVFNYVWERHQDEICQLSGWSGLCGWWGCLLSTSKAIGDRSVYCNTMWTVEGHGMELCKQLPYLELNISHLSSCCICPIYHTLQCILNIRSRKLRIIVSVFGSFCPLSHWSF